MGLPIDRVGAVLFDMDGVLIDTNAAVMQLWRRVGSLVGRELSDNELRADVLGCTPEHTVERLFCTQPEAARRWLLEEIRAGEPTLTYQPLPGAARLVRALAAAGVPLALVTSASAGRAAAVLDALDVKECFKVMVTWGDVERGKPDPQSYLLAASRLGVCPAECVVFEDSVNGVRAAVAAGTICVGVGVPKAAGPLLTTGAAAVVTSLTQVTLGGAGNGTLVIPAVTGG